jgi:hypothetical protein
MATERKSRNRWVDAISSMIELTQDGKLRWTVVPDASKVYDGKEITTSVFETTYSDRALRLYEVRVPSNFSPIERSLYSVRGEEPPMWYKEVILEFVDTEGRTLWTFPQVDALSDLLTSVQYQVAGVNDFLDTLIGEARKLPKRDSVKE